MKKKITETIRDVLESLKNGEVGLDETQNLIEVLVADKVIEKSIKWQDDGGIRIAVFKGRSLIRNSDRDNLQCDITFTGEPLNVYCDHSLTVKGNVIGSAVAGHSLKCEGFVGGDAKAGHSINCGDVKNNVKAGHKVSCGSVGGNITAGHGVSFSGKG